MKKNIIIVLLIFFFANTVTADYVRTVNLWGDETLFNTDRHGKITAYKKNNKPVGYYKKTAKGYVFCRKNGDIKTELKMGEKGGYKIYNKNGHRIGTLIKKPNKKYVEYDNNGQKKGSFQSNRKGTVIYYDANDKEKMYFR